MKCPKRDGGTVPVDPSPGSAFSREEGSPMDGEHSAEPMWSGMSLARDRLGGNSAREVVLAGDHAGRGRAPGLPVLPARLGLAGGRRHAHAARAGGRGAYRLPPPGDVDP